MAFTINIDGQVSVRRASMFGAVHASHTVGRKLIGPTKMTERKNRPNTPLMKPAVFFEMKDAIRASIFKNAFASAWRIICFLRPWYSSQAKYDYTGTSKIIKDIRGRSR